MKERYKIKSNDIGGGIEYSHVNVTVIQNIRIYLLKIAILIVRMHSTKWVFTSSVLTFKSPSLNGNYTNISHFIKLDIQSFSMIYCPFGQDHRGRSHFFEVWCFPQKQ